MNATALLALTLAFPAALERPYAQLPSAQVCALCHRQAVADLAAIEQALTLVGGWRQQQTLQLGDMMFSVDGAWQCGGWRMQRLVEARRDAEHVEKIWRAAWGAVAAHEVPAEYGPRPGADDWAERLAGMIGDTAFWRGELPLPLACR